MNRLFWGLFFILMDFKITVGSAVFGLLPDFAGYFLMMKGMEELSGESGHFDKGRHWAFGMVLASLILYVADLMNLSGMDMVGAWALGLVGEIVGLVILRRAVSGIRQMERENRWELRGEGLNGLWLVLAVITPICYLLNWVPLVGPVCTAAQWITGICFLAAFYGSRKRVYEYIK